MTPAFITREDHALFVRASSEEPPVMLLAGWAMDSRIWGETMLRTGPTGACDSQGKPHADKALRLKAALNDKQQAKPEFQPPQTGR